MDAHTQTSARAPIAAEVIISGNHNARHELLLVVVVVLPQRSPIESIEMLRFIDRAINVGVCVFFGYTLRHLPPH